MFIGAVVGGAGIGALLAPRLIGWEYGLIIAGVLAGLPFLRSWIKTLGTRD